MAVIRRKNTECSSEPMGRKQIADTLKLAAIHYYAHKTYSCYTELGVVPWGKRKADVFCLNTKGNYVIVETKSCLADYRTDDKWRDYLEHCNQFYFCVPIKVYNKLEDEFRQLVKQEKIGVMTLGEDGYIRVLHNAKKRKMDKKNKLRLLIKAAWRGGESKRTHRRRVRLYLT